MKTSKSTEQAKGFIAFFLRLFRVKSISIHQLTFVMLIISAFVSLGLMTGLLMYNESVRTAKKINELEESSLAKQKKKLHDEVNRVLFYLEYQKKNSPAKSLEEIQNNMLNYFKDVRFGNDGYIFINTFDGNALLFDGKRLDEPKNILKLSDPEGFMIFEKELELSKLPEGGYFQYLFKKIYDSVPQSKLSYVIGYKEWGWIIGTGDYLDNIEAEILLLESALKRTMYQNFLNFFLIFVSVSIILVLASYFFARWIQDQFNKFVRLLKQASLNNENKLVLRRIFIRELRTIGFEILQAEQLAKQFGNIIDQSINEVYIFDQESLKFVHVNQGAIQNCGYSLSELQLMTPLDIKPELNRKQFQEIIKPLKEKKTKKIQFETKHQRKNKSLYTVEVHLATSFINEQPIYVAFIYDISERKKTEQLLHLSQQRYSALFENAPISLWEEDFADLVKYIDQQIKDYKLGIEQLFEQHPEVLIHSASLIKVTDVNNQTLSLFEAQNKEELFGNLNLLLTEASILPFKQSVLALYRGDKQYYSEGENLTLKGKKLEVLLRWSFPSIHEVSNNKVIVSIVDLTELKKAEKELLTANTIINRSPAVAFLWRNEKGRPVEFVADSVEQLTGYTVDDFISERVNYNDIIHKDDIESVEKETAKSAQRKSKQSFAHEAYRILTKSGEIKWVNDTIFIRRNSKGKITHYEGVVHDITDKQLAEQKLLKNEEILKDAQRLAKIGSWELDIINNKLYWSDEAYRIFNLRPQEFGATYEAFLENIHPEDRAFVDEAYTKSLETKIIYDIDHRLLLNDGSIKYVHEYCQTFYDKQGKAIRSVGTVQDITERKQTENELEEYRYRLEDLVKNRTTELKESQNALLNLVDDLNQQSAELEKTNSRLAEINEELETFTYSVSHDLKAPLRGIAGYSQLLLDNCEKDIDEESRYFLENIRKSTLQMNSLIEDLLAYSRMERKNFQTKNIKLKPIIDNLLLAYSRFIDENHIQILNSFPQEYSLIGDKDGISLVLRNLLDNAIKFSKPNEICQIEIGGRESDTHWHIFVKDNGIGFDMKYHDRIFKIFQRLHLPEEYEGTGIGLAIVSKAIQRMNGKIWAESIPSQGAVFYLEIIKPS